MPIETLETKIEYCLKNYPETRNSDIRLYNCFLVNFYRDTLKYIDNEPCVSILDLYDLPAQSAIVRIRAKFQNDKRKYLPTDKEVAKRRGWQEEEWRRILGYNPEFRQVNLI